MLPKLNAEAELAINMPARATTPLIFAGFVSIGNVLLLSLYIPRSGGTTGPD